MAALASTVAGNPAYAAKQLDDLKLLVLPLLASPIVGEGSAYDAAYALARCLPGALHDAAFAVASALQMVMQSQLEGKSPVCSILTSNTEHSNAQLQQQDVLCVSAGLLAVYMCALSLVFVLATLLCTVPDHASKMPQST